MKFKEGDRVSTTDGTATVVDARGVWVNINYDGEQIWPGGDWYHIDDLELITE